MCISKGKSRTPNEVGLAVTNREGLVLAAKAFEATIAHENRRKA
ncbi:MAG: hypothetical protein NXI19_20815 [Alphaproteobacteria bacterium]|nr:hypothetical protein [Alphaproteobacteria bacterium]